MHALLRGGATGGEQVVRALDLHRADATHIRVIRLRQIAESGNGDVGGRGGLEDRLTGGERDLPAIDH